jgi:hypothetical protein
MFLKAENLPGARALNQKRNKAAPDVRRGLISSTAS